MPRPPRDAPPPPDTVPPRDPVGRVRRLRAPVEGWVPGTSDVPTIFGATVDDGTHVDDGASGHTTGERDRSDAASADVPASSGAGARRPAWAKRLVRSGPWGALAEKWVPESMQGARVDPGRRGAALLSVVAALAAVVAAVGVWWSRPQPTPVVAATVGSVGSVAASSPAQPPTGASVSTAAAQAPEPTGSAAPHGPILVSVTGRVRHPGLVTVPADARVADAIAAAGGVLDATDLTGLNLAARLSDGASVVVAGPGGSSVRSEESIAPGADGPAGAGDSASDVVDINSADLQGLQQLPGVGPVTAAAILEYRTQHGPFTDVAQLQEVSGIGPVTFARLAPHVTL